MSTDHLASGLPVSAEIDDVYLGTKSMFTVSLRFADDSRLTVDFPPESEAWSRILEAVTEVATRELSSLGNSGVVVVATAGGEPEVEPETTEDDNS